MRSNFQNHGELGTCELLVVGLVDEKTLETLVAALEKTCLKAQVKSEYVLNHFVFLPNQTCVMEDVFLENAHDHVLELGDTLLELNRC